MNEPDEAIMQFFSYDHLPEHLQSMSRAFAQLAAIVVENAPRGPERSVALRKLLEGKDAAVRALLTARVPWRDRQSGVVEPGGT